MRGGAIGTWLGRSGLRLAPAWIWMVSLVTCGLACQALAAPATIPDGSNRRGLKPEAPKVDMAIQWLPYVRPPLQASTAQTPGLAPVQAGAGAALSGPQLWTLGIEDRRLSMVLQRWSAQAGWQLVWEAERDFPIEAHVRIHADFLVALEEVMNSLADSDYPLQAVMNPQTGVLRVRRQHESLR